MAAQWMGFTISIDCGRLGVFQGVVTAVQAEPQSVTLSRAFHNGVPHPSPSIVISAHDIRDLTIIAAPQAQLEPVVELKKPIPTRPGRNTAEGTQNFHSQPAPPRALHLHDIETDAPRSAHNDQSSISSQLSGLSLERKHVMAASLLQFNASRISPEAPKGAVKSTRMSTAQTVSQRAQALAQSTAASSQGGFKLTAALGAHAGQTANSNTLKHLPVPSSSLESILHPGAAAAPVSPASSSSVQVPSLRSMPHKAVESNPLNAAAQAFFRGSVARSLQQGAAGPHLSPQGSSGPSQNSGASAQGSPRKNARGYQPGLLQAVGINADGYASGSGDGNRTPNRRDRLRQRWQARDEACFGSPSDNGFDQDFDFEKNLALFDKQAVFEEIAGHRPDLVQAANDPRRPQNYRHDQNILVNNRRMPTIIVPNPGATEYVTDDGLIIPSMRPELLRQLHQKAHDAGFTFDRQAEIFARCATEMSLQLLGGAHRLNIQNSHQWPTVIVMAGPHHQGTAGVMCARQLESQGVSTVTYVVNESAAPPLMRQELHFYKCSGCSIINKIEELPDTVDLVIMALAGHTTSDVANSLEYGRAASWASNKRAPVLALDPPAVGTPGIITKFALAPTLPLTYSPQNGKIYLCNLGMPFVVFKEMGIRYRSPFGSKFVIPLHPNDD